MEKSNKAVIYWLYFCSISILLMMVIGAFTRLTESGLSIAVWEPLRGTLPPLSHAEWERYFELYKQTPEFKMINNWMKLEDFQGIFWLEYIHRLLGRLIGFIFLVPMVYFYARKKIDKKLALKVFGILCLGGLQGAIGWFMVHSGLGDSFSVSHYRLALHLLVAVLIYSLTIWTAFNLKNNKKQNGGGLALFAKILCGMIIFMMMLGAFVAGKDAGFAYNTFPLMDGKFIPDGIYRYDPWWKNHLENGIMIQWQHRIFAYILSVTVIAFAITLVRKNFRNINSAVLLVAALMLQVALGVMTLLSFGTYADFSATYAYHKVLHTPVILGAMHQLGALILFTVALRIAHKLQRQ